MKCMKRQKLQKKLLEVQWVTPEKKITKQSKTNYNQVISIISIILLYLIFIYYKMPY